MGYGSKEDEGATRHTVTQRGLGRPGTIICMALTADDRTPLARLLGMVDSNSPHEALAAAKLADKLIRQRTPHGSMQRAEPPQPEAGDDRRRIAAWADGGPPHVAPHWTVATSSASGTRRLRNVAYRIRPDQR